MNTLVNTPAFIILSVYGSGDNESDVSRHWQLEAELDNNNINYKVVKGCYKGEKEYAFYIPLTSTFTLTTALNIARAYTQETILYVDSSRWAQLIGVFDQSKHTHLGTFQQVIKEEAESQDAYTYDLEHNAYYICK